LLLDRQRPQVLQQRGSADGLEVGLLAQDEIPIGHIPERCDGIVAQPRDLAGQKHHGERERDHKQQIQRGEQPACTPQPEAHEVNAALLLPLR
jgi:hypothetical protein